MQRNFYTAIKPFIIFLTCMGILPCYFKNNKLCATYIHSLYVVFLIATDLVLYYLYYTSVGSLLGLRQTPKTSEKIVIVATVVQVIVTLTNSIAGKKKYIQFSKTMLKCEDAFKKIMNVPHKLIKREVYTHAIIWILGIIINSVLQFHFIREEIAEQYMVNNIIYGYVWFINICVCIFAKVHILTIKAGFCILNECLTRMQKNRTWEQFKYEQFLKVKTWTPVVENLARIGTLHLELCGCIREFNDALGVIMIAQYFMSFVTILVTVYFSYITYQYSRFMYTVCCAMAAFSYTASLTTLCRSCSSTINEVKMFFKFATLLFIYFFNFH